MISITHPSPLSTRLLNTIRLLQTDTTAGASDRCPTACQRITKLVGKLAAGLVDVLAPLEHATAVLPGLCGGRHCWVLFLLEDDMRYELDLKLV
jgi:hypothetical protein